MKTTLLTIFILLACISVSAQKKLTDKELEGLKGSVKTVANDFMPINNSQGEIKNPTRKTESKYFFDKNGKLTEILYDSHDFKYIFSQVDGFKTFKNIKLRERDLPRFGSVGPSVEPPPIEEPEKLHEPDKRYDLKFVYEYDAQGRVITERHYQNNGKLFRLTKTKYDDKGNISEEEINETNAITKRSYKYDEKNNLIEEISDRKLKVPGTDSKNKTVYSEYKIDAQGNWTQRKRIFHFNIDGEPDTAESMEYRTIVYY